MKFISAISLPIFFIVLSVAFGEEYIDYRLLPDPKPDPIPSGRVARALNDKCVKPGVICNNCKDIHLCDSQGSSSLIWTCPGTATCNAGACSAKPSPSCSDQGNKKFICSSEGIFPDPADCFKYHICVKTDPRLNTKTDYARTCTTNDKEFYSFNPKNGYCDKKLTTRVCTTPYLVPICELPAQTAALDDNPSIYFICAKYSQTTSPGAAAVLYPYLYLCENGKTYNGDFQCITPDITTTAVPTTPCESTTEATATT